MPMYVLEFHWSWDKYHTDFATMSVEEFNLDSQKIKDLEDPDGLGRHEHFILRQFKKIAEIQNGCAMAGPRFTAMTIYRVIATKTTSEKIENKTVSFELKPIFRFNDNGNPIPID